MIAVATPTVHLETVDSTSLHARRVIATGPLESPLLIFADTQSGGLGRQGRVWSSPHGGLWCTLIWPGPPAHETPALEGLGVRIGLACLRTIDAVVASHGNVQLKWPNDVLLNDRKVLGVLTEAVREQRGSTVLVGVGINANFMPDALPPEIRGRATTLQAALGAPIDLDMLRQRLIANLIAALRGDPPTVQACLELAPRLHALDEQINAAGPAGSRVSGRLVGLAPDGRAIIDTSQGRVLVASPIADGPE